MAPGALRRQPAATGATPEVVRWSQAGLVFELATRDAMIASRARAVFAPWNDGGADVPSCRFEVRRAPDGEGAASGDALAEARASCRWEAHETVSGERRVASSADELLRWIELSAVQVYVSRTEGRIALHGALLDVAGAGVLVVGPPQAGKSSLACALWRDGAALLSDDVALLDLSTAHARPGPRRIALRHASRSLVGEDLWQRIVAAPSSAPTDDGWCFHPGEIDGRPRPSATRVCAVVFLERRGRPALGGAAAARMAPAHAVLAWLPYVLGPRRIDPGDAIRRAAPLAERVPAWDLARGPLAAMTARVRAMLEEI